MDAAFPPISNKSTFAIREAAYFSNIKLNAILAITEAANGNATLAIIEGSLLLILKERNFGYNWGKNTSLSNKGELWT